MKFPFKLATLYLEQRAKTLFCFAKLNLYHPGFNLFHFCKFFFSEFSTQDSRPNGDNGFVVLEEVICYCDSACTFNVFLGKLQMKFHYLNK